MEQEAHHHKELTTELTKAFNENLQLQKLELRFCKTLLKVPVLKNSDLTRAFEIVF